MELGRDAQQSEAGGAEAGSGAARSHVAQRTLQGNLAAAYTEAQGAQSQLDSLRGSVDLATESLRLTLLRYQAGESTALEVVDAQNTLTSARNAYDDGLARYRIAMASLQTLTGTL